MTLRQAAALVFLLMMFCSAISLWSWELITTGQAITMPLVALLAFPMIAGIRFGRPR